MGVAVLMLFPIPALAQTLIISPAPQSTKVTLYRDPTRGERIDYQQEQEELDADDLNGFALVTETRTVSIPAGPAVVRFEGVAGNILPESAIVAGLPSDVREKNLDADLLSPRTLYDRMLGRRVLIRRTDKATGRVRQEQAVIRSGAAGAGVLSLRTGIEALECAGLNEQLVFPEVPAGLSAKPTLSIRTDSPRPVTAAITLSYLAGGFDWRADYTLTLRPDGRADLFAWVTLVSSDVTSFSDAEVAAVAGRVNRAEDEGLGERYDRDNRLHVRCWPTRPDYAAERVLTAFGPPPPPPPPSPPAPEMAESIVVTGQRVAFAARQEELGDLKLYRFPARVTVASQAQKQVAMLDRRAVPVQTIYRSDVYGDSARDLRLVLKLRNRQSDSLGLPLPAGSVAVFQEADARPVLLGTVPTRDKAVGEEVELELEPGPAVSAEIVEMDDAGTPPNVDRLRLTVSNANPVPIRYEARISIADDQRLSADSSLVRKDGRSVWSPTIPANGRATLGYTLTRQK